MTRKEIALTDTTLSVALTLSEGNPGALTILMDMLAEKHGATLLDALSLDDMNIRGTQIWVAFKDFAKEDWAKFLAAIHARDVAMVEVVNAEGARGNHRWRAIPYGASSGDRPVLSGEVL